MKIGFLNHPRKDIIEEIEWIGKKGFDFVDLFIEEDMAVPEKIDTAKVKKTLRKYSLDAVGHTAWYLPTGSPVKSLRHAAVSEANRTFPLFSKLGVKYVTIHSKWPPGMFSAKEGISFQAESLKAIVKSARQHNLNIMLEPGDSPRDSLKNIAELLGNVPGLYFHLDIGHASLQKRKPEQFIKKFHKILRHVHLHDNHGKYDEHLPLGKGNLKIKKIIKTLKKYYDGTITIEVFSKNKKRVLQSRNKLRKHWNNS
ncbi:MAG: sugar phosphate isomerase/epimerase [Candidatus Aenigmarchaeota archaeon]|nr:sugar phosphate isomerase/epimerase [Candidatus Aenigmarchaeota archaeon]